jgi:hypothetical protein
MIGSYHASLVASSNEDLLVGPLAVGPMPLLQKSRYLVMSASGQTRKYARATGLSALVQRAGISGEIDFDRTAGRL